MRNLKLVRLDNGRYLLQAQAENQWGFSLLAPDGYAAPGGFGLADGQTWSVSRRSWPRWALELRQRLIDDGDLG